ncbi:40157_t:CDS:2 [Gigaspora margarita]|uniref:40157_t:CDS:1 n=1 Tax=Gigaspora margarita TaxID=4874 RepID=A0ABN7VF64_GIGMA|nr:40157_t:CDS:2 [Gigaspora margarita]
MFISDFNNYNANRKQIEFNKQIRNIILDKLVVSHQFLDIETGTDGVILDQKQPIRLKNTNARYSIYDIDLSVKHKQLLVNGKDIRTVIAQDLASSFLDHVVIFECSKRQTVFETENGTGWKLREGDRKAYNSKLDQYAVEAMATLSYYSYYNQ